ncbi:MAG: UDP-2,3-diacylglucosamine diphosphatase [Verrucomicrobiaceae bacterium]|nr:UDP-2,3-diacylglucosamine diphosphatase [Verrucomicrobiaceae bacterium]
MKTKLRVKTLFLSDVHLGMPDSKALQAAHFLRHCQCEQLILNGDIVDAWALKGGTRWLPAHTYFVRTVLKKMEKEGTEVIYLRGNHDDILERFLPLRIAGLTIKDEHIHESPHGRYLVVHGDGFDAVTVNHVWLAKIGAVGYNALLRVNRVHNAWRRWRKKPPFSLSAWVKSRVKQAVGFVGKYEEQLQSLARWKNCRGIICGHIHTPANKLVGDVHYLNSGDWVESMTAIVEHLDRTFQVVSYHDFCTMTGRKPKGDNESADVRHLDLTNLSHPDHTETASVVA